MASVTAGIKELPARDRRVLFLRFRGKTQSEIAEEVGFHRCTVRILASTLDTLRSRWVRTCRVGAPPCRYSHGPADPEVTP